MTKEQFTEAMSQFVAIIDAWNDAAADDDRGRNNHAITVTLWDDGSGFIGTRRSQGESDRIHDFDNLDALAEWAKSEGAEFEDAS